MQRLLRLTLLLAAIAATLFVIAPPAQWQGWLAAVGRCAAPTCPPAAEPLRGLPIPVFITTTPGPAAPPRIVVVTATPPPAAAPPPVTLLDERTLRSRYGSEGYPTAEAMPPELRLFFQTRLAEVAAFFKVRPEDLEGALRARNEGQLRLSRASAEGEAEGIARLGPALWNGWARAAQGGYVADLRTIEQGGGLGFDWSMRELWRAWQAGRHDGAALVRGTAHPARFENSVAALARFLAREGLTEAAAESDPEGHAARLAEALAALATLPPQGGPSSTSSASLVGSAPPVTASQPLAARLGMAFGVQPTEAELAALLAPLPVPTSGDATTLESEADQRLNALIVQWMAEGQAARVGGYPLRWPFIWDGLSLDAQRLAVAATGHLLLPWELEPLLVEHGADMAALAERLAARDDADLYAALYALFDTGLQRSARGLPISPAEVAPLVQGALADGASGYGGRYEAQRILDRAEHRIRLRPDYVALNGDRTFTHLPLDPWPNNILKPFGSPASYQPGGIHSGLDVRGSRAGGREPLLFAMDEGRVIHVGPLYCNSKGLCRGAHAIVIDHGNNVYSIYSHNSEASVRVGDAVVGGQPIGRQGNEGYSRGSHLHLEVHVGAPWSGDWVQPFGGGEFINPLPWLPLK